MRTLIAGLLALLALPNAGFSADTVVAFDGTVLKGQVLRLKDGRLELRQNGEEKTKPVALRDLSTVKLVPMPPDPKRHQSRLLIDNDGDHGPTEKSGKIKLRKGLQWFTLLYFQGGQGSHLSLSWEGPGIKKTEVPQSAIVKWQKNANEVKLSPGLDEEGYRQPDELDNPMATGGYKLYEWTESGLVTEVGDLRNLPLKKYGTSKKVGLNFTHSPTNFGLNFYGLLKVPRDGEYTFYLKSDDGSQLYFGKVPGIAQPSMRAPKPEDWSITLTEQGHLDVPLSGWNDTGPEIAFKVGRNEVAMNIPNEFVREAWTREAADKKIKVDRSNEPADVDVVYAKNAEGKVQQVSGTVVGIVEGALKFRYQDQERSIKLERVVGIVMRQPTQSAEATRSQRVRILFDLVGPNQFVGHLAEMTTGSVVLELPWGESVTVSRNVVYRMTILNGRMQSLPEMTPSEVAQTPFFDRMLAWQSGTSLTGSPLKIGEKTYTRGLCLHSRTRLTYDIDQEFERFQCDLGLQHPEGEAGNATVRILADGSELFVADEVVAGKEPQVLDLDLTGKDQLTLEVDFGRGMHVGDHVVFGNPRLLRPELTP